MNSSKALEMLNNGRIEDLKKALQDEIYNESLKGKPNAKKRYAAMKKYFTLVDNPREICKKPCEILYNGKSYHSFTNSYSLALTTESCGEIEMFEALRNATNLPLGVLNVLIIYVIDSKNGEIPSYNYFLKVINTWKRAQIKSTKDAIDYISGKQKQKSTKSYKPQKEVPTWYNEYVEEQEQKKKTNDNKQLSDLDELKEFFKPIKKE